MLQLLILTASLGADLGCPVPHCAAPALSRPVRAVQATPPRPEGDGWQYDAAKGHWWKYATPVAAPAHLPTLPQYFEPRRTLRPATSGGCPNGQCPR